MLFLVFLYFIFIINFFIFFSTFSVINPQENNIFFEKPIDILGNSLYFNYIKPTEKLGIYFIN